MSSPRLAIILSHPTQYYSPWFRHLATTGAVELRVFYLWDFGVTPQHDRKFGRAIRWDVDLLSGYDHEFVPNRASDPGTHHFLGLHNPTLRQRLDAWQPEAILLFGYAYRTYLGLLLRPPAPLIFRGDSHLLGHRSPSWLKRTVLHWVYSRCTGVTYVGQANRDYFRTFGVPEARLHFVPHCVDDSRFKRTPEIDAAAATKKSALGLTCERIILYAGKLIPEKQPAALLEAYLQLLPADTALVFVGDGSERPALQAMVNAHPGAKVRFLPFANQSEMPATYAMADLFVLPSRSRYETWGLAVNEAMHLGVPCLVSDRVGCQQDLVTDGETGWVFPATDQVALGLALQRAVKALAGDAPGYRTRVMRRISEFNYAKATANMRQILESIAR